MGGRISEKKTKTQMEVPLQTRALLLILASATALNGQVDAREIIRRAVSAEARNWKVARNYGLVAFDDPAVFGQLHQRL